MFVVLHPEIKVFEDVSIIALQSFRESYTLFASSTIKDVSASHPEHIPYSIFYIPYSIFHIPYLHWKESLKTKEPNILKTLTSQ